MGDNALLNNTFFLAIYYRMQNERIECQTYAYRTLCEWLPNPYRQAMSLHSSWILCMHKTSCLWYRIWTVFWRQAANTNRSQNEPLTIEANLNRYSFVGLFGQVGLVCLLVAYVALVHWVQNIRYVRSNVERDSLYIRCIRYSNGLCSVSIRNEIRYVSDKWRSNSVYSLQCRYARGARSEQNRSISQFIE